MVDSVISVKLHATISGDSKSHMHLSRCLLVEDGLMLETIGKNYKKILHTDLEKDGNQLSSLTKGGKICITIEKKITSIFSAELEL
jgi:hypothetical protein